jgi:predicted aspartyl protease
MERALVEEDPKLASTLRGTAFRRSARRRAIAAGACFVVGVAVLMTGAVARITPIGIAGFVIMLVSATIALTAMRGQQTQAAPDPRTAAHPSHGFTVIDGGRTRRIRRQRRNSGHSFMSRVEDRWRRRREGGGF